MPKKEYIIILNNSTRILVFFETIQGKVENFIIKLETFINNHWIEIERYDTFHGYVHKDIMEKNGNKKRVVKYELINNESGMNMAIKDFKENYKLYLRRFLNEK